MTSKASPQRPTLIVVLLILLGSGTFYTAYQANTELTPLLPPLAAQKNLKRWFFEESTLLLDDLPLNHFHTVNKIYARTNYKLLWLNNYELAPTGELLLQQLQETSADQIYDYQYHLTYIQQRLHHLQTLPKEATALDILLTDAFVSYAEDVLSEKLLPSLMTHLPKGLRPVAYQDPFDSQGIDHDNIIRLLGQNHTSGALTKVLHSMTPTHQDYDRLRDAMEHYQKLAQSGEWQPLPDGPSLVLGQRGPQIGHLRRLLTQYGDFPVRRGLIEQWFADDTPLSEKQANTFDLELEKSLKQFQARHGQKADGKAGRITRRLLNTPPSYRIKQIALNMKRWRELPKDLGERYIWVNMTNYRLQLINRGAVEMNMKVIIGKSRRRTPVMQESISTVVLNPYWNVPRRITVVDILPKAQEDLNYLRERNINIYENWTSNEPVPLESIDWDNMSRRNFPYRMRQDPGHNNALGAVKFVIPNDESIYLHDTSNPELFDLDRRALSSGCVRVEQPLELARAILKGGRWTNEKIQQTLDSGETRYLRVPKKIPTYLFYATAWVDNQGHIQFRDDIYQRDRAVNLADKRITL